MLRTKKLVINTSPILAIAAALNDLDVLQHLYKQVIVPFEVCEEIFEGGSDGFAVKEFVKAKWLDKKSEPIKISPFLKNSLDMGEASVIQTALDNDIQTVCIDERSGRRIARLNMLNVTGSIGILVCAKKQGYPIDMNKAVLEMQAKGIYLGKNVIDFALDMPIKSQKIQS